VNKKFVGVGAILLASVMWAIEPIFAKLSYQTTDFIQTSAIRAIVAAFTAFIYVLIAKKGNFKISKKQLPFMIYIALIGTLFADFMYLYGLTKIPVINAVIIGHMQPLFIILFAFFLLKGDKLTKFDYIGIALLMISGVLVTTKTLDHLFSFTFGSIGDVIVLLATIAWATTAIAMRKYLKNMNAGVLTFYRFFLASLFFIFYLIVTYTFSIVNIYQVFIGVIVGIGTILYYEGLKRIKAAQVSGLELSTPFFAALFAFIILGEVITGLQVISILFLFLGILLLSKKEETKLEL
jgi:drug/metabolite transporter (DMT)-like permease